MSDYHLNMMNAHLGKSSDFETLPIGTEAALRDVVDKFAWIERQVLWGDERAAFRQARAILAQIDTQRKGATDAG